MKLLSLLHLMEVNLTSVPPKSFFHKNKVEKFKTVSNGCFLTRRLCFEKKSIQQSAASNIENRPIISFGKLVFKIVFLTRNKQTMILQCQLSRPFSFLLPSFTNDMERFNDRQENRHGMAPRRLVSDLVPVSLNILSLRFS